MARLKALWQNITDSLWLTPALLTLGGAGLAVLLIRLDSTILERLDGGGAWWLFGGSADGAQGVLGAIAGSIITVTGVVFSVTIVALQLASSQFTPRVLRQFTADRANQVVLGVFIATFTYTLIVQRTVRGGDGEDAFVPNVAVTGAVLLALLSIGFLIFFINHAARSIQASVIIDSVAEDTIRVIRTLFPDPHGPPPAVPAEDYVRGRKDPPIEVVAAGTGYVQAVNEKRLREIAEVQQVLIALQAEPGTYVLRGQVIMNVWPADVLSPDVVEELGEALVLGFERTPHQDVEFGVIELMDIAVKALSPSVNDPTTALLALDRLVEILLVMAGRERGDRVIMAPGGRPLVLVRRPRLERVVGLAFNQIRHYGAENPTVAAALLHQLGELAALSPADARPVFVQHLHDVVRTAKQRIVDRGDLERVESAAMRALSRAAG